VQSVAKKKLTLNFIKNQILKLLLLLFLISINLSAQEVFCKKIKPTQFYVLDKKLHETSGLVKYNNRFWTHNDDTDCNLYALDTLTGTIIETYNLPNSTNTDWEELAQDESHFYIGDFGNNATGNRTDLHILKIEKLSIINRNPNIERIDFKYPNQSDFSPQQHNKTNFDCEAMIIVGDSIFLFSKEWKSKKTTVYSLPKSSGKYTANKKGSIRVKGLVCGAFFFEPKRQLTLCGYTKFGKPFVFQFYDFENFNFFSGKSIKYKLKSRFEQIESIFSEDGIQFWITNEKLDFLWIHKLPKLQLFDFSKLFKKY
jgi:hypothetical protein